VLPLPFKELEANAWSAAMSMKGKVISYNPSTKRYLLRYFDAPDNEGEGEWKDDRTGVDEEILGRAEVLLRMETHMMYEETEEEEEEYVQGWERPESPLHIDSGDDDDDDEGEITDMTTSEIAPEHEEGEHEMDEEETNNERISHEGDKRSVYPQWGTGGKWGNAQSKRFSKVTFDFGGYGPRVNTVQNHRCTDIAQLYSPQTKYFCNKPSNRGFHAGLWKLPMAILGFFSDFYQAILSVIKPKRGRTTTLTGVIHSIIQLVQGLEDYSSRVNETDMVYARMEFTIAIDHETIATQAPPLPITSETCPLSALEVVEAAVFKERFSNFVSVITTPLSHITQSASHFQAVVDFVGPQGKAALMCLTEMGVNTLGGGGVWKRIHTWESVGIPTGHWQLQYKIPGPTRGGLDQTHKKGQRADPSWIWCKRASGWLQVPEPTTLSGGGAVKYSGNHKWELTEAASENFAMPRSIYGLSPEGIGSHDGWISRAQKCHLL
jgi:hypothetical protein